MKLLIAYILAATTSLMADTVQFAWGYDQSTSPISNFRIYTGATPHASEQVFVIPPEARRAGVPVPDGHYAWITATGLNGVESEESHAVQFRPVTVQLVVEQSKDLREWGGRLGVFVFRVPDAVVDQVEQRLSITKVYVGVRVYGQDFSVPIPTGVGKKFFRSYIAPAP